MKKSVLLTMLMGVSGVCLAQDLDTVTIADHFNVGTRGNNTGTGTFGAASPTGSEFSDYLGADVTATTSIRYINTFAGASAGDPTFQESPVVTVTSAMNQPDRNSLGTVPAIVANTRPGSLSPSTAVQISDDGGHNGLFFGDTNDKNYFVEVDVYCWDQSALGLAQYEHAVLAARCARDNDTSMTEFTYNIGRTGSYFIKYDYMARDIKCGKWTTGNSAANVTTRNATAFTQFGATLPAVTTGWHTFRIECRDSRIVFTVDGVEIANVVDTSNTVGRPGIGYWEASVATASERTALFDNLKAGPATIISSVNDWTLY